MLTGSCLCGSVAYEVDADPGPIVHCHCATCRKTHGSAFSTVTNVPRDRFRWTKGENLLKGFKSSPGKTALFLHAMRIAYRRRARRHRHDPAAHGMPRHRDRRAAQVHIWRSDASWYDPKDPLPEWPEGKAPKS